MQQSSGILTNVLERITDAFVALDTHWCYTYMNKKAGEIFQRNPADMIGKHIWTEFPEGVDQPFFKAYNRAMAEQQYIHVEEYYPPYDKWFENHIYPSPDGVSIFFRDITEQKKTASALEIREELFRALLENNAAVIALTDDALNSIYQSPSSTRITGWTADDMKVKDGINYFHPDDIIIVKNTVADAIKNPGIPQPYIARYLHKNGNYVWLQGTATKLPDESIVKGIVFNSHDVNEKIELELLLQKATRLARIGSWDVDLVKQTVYWNDITREIHEADNSFVPDLATGLNFYKEGPGRKLITQKVQEALELGKPWDEELEIVTVKNNVRWIRTIGETEFVDGKCVKIYGSFQDITERKLAEEKILFEQLNKMALINSTDDFIWSVSQDLKLIAANKSFLKNIETVTGIILKSGDEILLKVFPQEFLDQWQSYYNRALLGESFREETYSNYSTDKSPTWIETAFNPIYLNQDIIGIACHSRNITERKKAEEKIRLNEVRLLKAQQIGKFGYWHQDIDSDTVWASKEAMCIYGFGTEEGELHRAKIAACIIDVNKVKEAAVNLVEHGKEYKIDIRINPADGSPMKYISALAELEKNEKGEPVKIVGTLQDITDRKKAEDELRLSEIRTRRIFESDMIGFFYWDVNGEVLDANDRFLEMTGYSKQDLHENKINWSTITPPEYQELDRLAIEHIVNTGICQPYEKEYIRKDGSRMAVEIGATALEGDNFGKCISYIMDITERKKAEEEIKKSNERFQLIARTTNDALWEWNFETGELWANQIHQHLYDVDVSDPVPKEKAWQQKIHPADRERVIATKKNAYESDTKIWISEYRFETKNGFIDIYDRCYIIRNADGKVIRATGTMMDITERKKAEENLKNSEEKRRLMMNAAMDGIIFSNPIGEITYWNPAAEKIFGWKSEEVMGRTLADIIIPQQYRKMHDKGMENYIKTGYGPMLNKLLELSAIDHKGREFPVELTVLPIKQVGEEFFCAFIRDITERKKAEKELAENENYLRTILDTEPECVKILNSKGELISMNPAGLAMIEADNEQQVLGHKMTELVVEKYRQGFNDLSKAVFKGEQGGFEFEITGLKGGHRWLETHAVPLKDTAGKIINLLGVTRDITLRKQDETDLKNTTEQLRLLTAHLQTIREEERKRIAREIHDDLGQQLTAIKMDTVWIDKQISSEKIAVKDKLQNIMELLNGSHQSITKILNELRPAVLDENALLEALQWQGQQFTKSSGKPVHFTSNQGSIKVSHETATCIFRVYQESLTNIMRYAGANKVISSLNIINNSIILTIEDDGKGFDTGIAASKKRFGILGMKERVYSLKGKFDLVSSPGKGTKIVISLPYNT